MQLFRYLEKVLESRLGEKSPLIQVVVGPRQVGKTTAILQALNGRGLYQSADAPIPTQPEKIQEWWEKSMAMDSPILAIDEIQKIPGWAEMIKKLWDRNPRPKVILSGSASLSIEKKLKESLAGRFELLRAEHWNYSEAFKLFSMTQEEYIEFGCYPGSISLLRKDKKRWADYIRDSIIEPVIGRDILQLHPVQNPSLLRQLFGLAVSLPAQVVSLNKLQGQLQDQGAVSTLQHYLDLLSLGFMVSGIQKYTKTSFRTKRSSPKIVVHDNALIRAMERISGEAISPDTFGRYFENAVIARFLESGWEVYYWNDRDLEVDLVAIGPKGEKLAIEIKSSKVSEKELKGLKKFIELFPEFSPCLLSFPGQRFEGFKSIDSQKALSLTRENPFLED